MLMRISYYKLEALQHVCVSKDIRLWFKALSQ